MSEFIMLRREISILWKLVYYGNLRLVNMKLLGISFESIFYNCDAILMQI